MRSLVLALATMVVVTSLGLVYVRHKNRIEFVSFNNLEAKRDGLEINWRELLIESRTWSKHYRVDEDAQAKLKMRYPEAESIVIVDMQARTKESDQ